MLSRYLAAMNFFDPKNRLKPVEQPAEASDTAMRKGLHMCLKLRLLHNATGIGLGECL
jgi:hypothetical protein